MAFRKSFATPATEKKDGIRLTGLFADPQNADRAAGTMKFGDMEKLIDLLQTSLNNQHPVRIMAFFNNPPEKGKPDMGLLAYESIPQATAKRGGSTATVKPRGNPIRPSSSSEEGDE